MTDFHFIRPWWLLALVLIALIAYLLKHLRVSQSGWQQVIPAHLVTTLLSGEHQKQKHSILLPCFIALITILALAGPTWQKLPQPVYNVKKGAVVILDLSTSMYATDLAPNRLTRARFKVLDLLDKLNEGDVGLIAYAGDSFVISPLTEDTNNIKLLLPELAPNIMPVQGSNPLLALTMADDMLKNAGHIKGDIFWLTDEADQYDVEEISNFFTKIKHHINILGVGTQNGAPIKLPNGQLLKDNSGSIVVPQLTSSALELLANKGRGTYKTLTNSANDINTLLASSLHSFSNGEQQNNKNSNNKSSEISEENQNSTTSDTYQDMGPYLLLLIIPLLLPYFRRGSLMALLPCCLWFSQVPESFAQQVVSNAKLGDTVNASSNNNSENSTGTNTWENLWQTQNQQAQTHYQNENYQQAAEQFSDNMWQGSAHYKNGNFAEALAAFEQEDSAQALYNQGNSLAKLGQLEEAATAYEQALAKNPNLSEASANKQAVEKVLEQQKQQQNQEGDPSGEKSDESSNKSSDENSEQDNSESQSEQNSSENSNDSSEESSEKSSEKSSNDNSKGNESENNEETDKQSSSNNDESEQSQPSEEELAQYKKALEDELKKQTEQSDEENNEATASQASAQDDNSATDEEAPQVASLSAEELAAQENEQHKQQLLKKLTDNPALLLRNKMKLEYQKRRQERQSSGVNKQW